MKLLWTGCLLLCATAPLQSLSAQDPITLIIKEGITKVIVAMDLKIQRLQNEVIWLQTAQKALENEMTSGKLTEITSWVEKQRALYEQYFEELRQLKAVLASYQRIGAILRTGQLLVQEYTRAWSLVKSDRHFTEAELRYMGQVYTALLERSARNLEALTGLMASSSVAMSDSERLALLSEGARTATRHLTELRAFTEENVRLSLSRATDLRDIERIKHLYALP